MPDLPENEQPNVLTREEAALLVKANEQPRPDSDEEMERFSAILDRLAEWVEQPEKARVECGRCDDTGVSSYGGALTECKCAEQPAPTNLAEKLREEGESRMGSYGGGTYQFAHRKAADALEAAIPPEVWGLLVELHGACVHHAHESSDWEAWGLALGETIDTYCPPHIQQQHGWEPRREETT